MNVQVYILDWKTIPGYDQKYLFNKTGVLVRLHPNKRSKVITPRIDRGGYTTLRLTKNGKTSTQYLHRLIAKAFIPNPENKPIINHKNGKKTDNWFENLEWCTHTENMKHAHVIGLMKIKPKAVINTCNGETYRSIKEAAKAININYGTCRNYLNGNIKTNKTCLRLAS